MKRKPDWMPDDAALKQLDITEGQFEAIMGEIHRALQLRNGRYPDLKVTPADPEVVEIIARRVGVPEKVVQLIASAEQTLRVTQEEATKATKQ